MIGSRGYTDGPYGQIHYRDTGTGVPLLLFHQAPMSHRQFDSVYPLLHDHGIRAIGVDKPGFGMSDPTDFVPTIRDYARVAAPLLDQLEIEAASMLGKHTGAAVATEAAVLLEDQALGLILNVPTPFNEKARAEGLEYVEIHEKSFTPERNGSHLAKAYINRTSYPNESNKWSLTIHLYNANHCSDKPSHLSQHTVIAVYKFGYCWRLLTRERSLW